MSYSISIPAFSKHRHTNDTLDMSTKRIRFSYRVHDLTQNSCIINFIRTSCTVHNGIFTFEIVYFITEYRLEIIINYRTRLIYLGTINKQCRSLLFWKVIAVIAEQRKHSVNIDGISILIVHFLIACNILVNLL